MVMVTAWVWVGLGSNESEHTGRLHHHRHRTDDREQRRGARRRRRRRRRRRGRAHGAAPAVAALARGRRGAVCGARFEGTVGGGGGLARWPARGQRRCRRRRRRRRCGRRRRAWRRARRCALRNGGQRRLTAVVTVSAVGTWLGLGSGLESSQSVQSAPMLSTSCSAFGQRALRRILSAHPVSRPKAPASLSHPAAWRGL